MRSAIVALAAAVFLTVPMTARAEMQPVRVTGYCISGRTASGIETQEGICAFRKEDIGKRARVYNADGELIGEYLIADTGKKGGAVRKGLAVDIWRPTKEECYSLTQQGYIEILEEEVCEE